MRNPPGLTRRSREQRVATDIRTISSEGCSCWRWCQLVEFYVLYVLYRVLILSNNYQFWLPVASPPRVLEVNWVEYVNMIKDPTGSGTQWMSDKIITLYITVWFRRILVLQNVQCIITVYVCIYECGFSSCKPVRPQDHTQSSPPYGDRARRRHKGLNNWWHCVPVCRLQGEKF